LEGRKRFIVALAEHVPSGDGSDSRFECWPLPSNKSDDGEAGQAEGATPVTENRESCKASKQCPRRPGRLGSADSKTKAQKEANSLPGSIFGQVDKVLPTAMGNRQHASTSRRA